MKAVERVLTGVDAFFGAVLYFYNFEVTQVAIRVGAHMCNLGGHTGIARQQHGFDSQARACGISIVPNCGQVPGMGITLMVYSMELLPQQAVWREAEAEKRQALEAIKATDRLIDCIVYQLYGLTDEEIAVVEGV